MNLNVDLDIMLCVLSQSLTEYLAISPSAPTPSNAASSKPPGTIITTTDTVTVRLERRAYSPSLRDADLPADTIVSWWATAPYATKSPDPLAANLLRGNPR